VLGFFTLGVFYFKEDNSKTALSVLCV